MTGLDWRHGRPRQIPGQDAFELRRLSRFLLERAIQNYGGSTSGHRASGLGA
jgi:hypothetical protein